MKNYVFCKHNNTEKCYNCDRTCPSVSNILYGVVFKLPIIKQIYKYISNKIFEKVMKLEEEMFEKYGGCENESIKLIFGVKSYDDLCECDVNLYTMNDLDVIYDKQTKKYSISIEAFYQFDSIEGQVRYLNGLLEKFTKYMTDNNLDKNYKISFYDIFYGNININCIANSIEECYARFKFIVEGFNRTNNKVGDKIK